MPARQQGALAVVLCTGTGVKTVSLDQNGQPVQTQHRPCDWSLHHSATGPGPAFVPLAHLTPILRPTSPPRPKLPVLLAQNTPRSIRAPPTPL